MLSNFAKSFDAILGMKVVYEPKSIQSQSPLQQCFSECGHGTTSITHHLGRLLKLYILGPTHHPHSHVMH